MRPVPIPDEKIWKGAVRKSILPPNGDMTSDECRSVDALIDIPNESGMFAGVPRFSMLLELEPGDLERLQSGANIWLCMRGPALVPFDVVIDEEA